MSCYLTRTTNYPPTLASWLLKERVPPLEWRLRSTAMDSVLPFSVSFVLLLFFLIEKDVLTILNYLIIARK